MRHRGLWAWLLLPPALWLAAVGLVAWQQEHLIFRARVLPPEHRFDLGPDVHEVTIPVDGAVLHALHLRLPSPDGVVFHLHGNAGHVGSWFTRADFYRRLNVDLFMVDYRGFGKSSGRIESEYDLHADIRAAWAHVAPAYAGRCRIVFGRSLGTGLAVQLAAEVRPDLTVLVSPYESLARVADEQYPWVPGVLLRYPMRTDLALPRVDTPVWMVHGARDRLIPPGHSASLQAIAPQAERLLLPDAGHEDVHRHPAYDEALAAVLRRTLSSSCRRSCRPRRRARG